MLKIALPAALAAAFFSAPAIAQDRLADVHVRYGDLDLTDPAGIAALDRRLARAIVATCPGARAPGLMTRRRAALACQAEKRAEVAALRQGALARAADRANLALANAALAQAR